MAGQRYETFKRILGKVKVAVKDKEKVQETKIEPGRTILLSPGILHISTARFMNQYTRYGWNIQDIQKMGKKIIRFYDIYELVDDPDFGLTWRGNINFVLCQHCLDVEHKVVICNGTNDVVHHCYQSHVFIHSLEYHELIKNDAQQSCDNNNDGDDSKNNDGDD